MVDTAVRGHRDLEAWKQAMFLAGVVYKATGGFPSEERYGLMQQMRRAAVSIPSNIAEGAGRGGQRQFHHFLSVARGSLSALEPQFLLAVEFGYIEQEVAPLDRIAHLFRLIAGLQKSLKARMT